MKIVDDFCYWFLSLNNFISARIGELTSFNKFTDGPADDFFAVKAGNSKISPVTVKNLADAVSQEQPVIGSIDDIPKQLVFREQFIAIQGNSPKTMSENAHFRCKNAYTSILLILQVVSRLTSSYVFSSAYDFPANHPLEGAKYVFFHWHESCISI